jgi:hypothetical protein
MFIGDLPKKPLDFYVSLNLGSIMNWIGYFSQINVMLMICRDDLVWLSLA